MRYLFLFVAAVLFAGCSDKNIELNGNIKGVAMGSVMIKDGANELIYKADISDGKFHIDKHPLTREGFYTINYSSSPKHEIYLEPGSTYTINADNATPDAYPEITTTSKKQTELSAYYKLLKDAKATARAHVMALDSQMRSLDDMALAPEDRSVRIQQLRNQQLDANVVDKATIFKELIKLYPSSEIIPHLMLNTEYQLNPVGYYEAFKKLSEDARESEDGKVLEQKLKQLSSLSAGGEAPPIEGSTPDGKPVDLKSLNKKVILVDFWRARNSQSESDHNHIIKTLLPNYGAKGLTVVSISLDSDREQWIKYVGKSGMTWVQVSDLKGDESPNVQNWGLTKIPTYYLVDGKGRIIKRCVDYYEAQTGLSDYFAGQP